MLRYTCFSEISLQKSKSSLLVSMDDEEKFSCAIEAKRQSFSTRRLILAFCTLKSTACLSIFHSDLSVRLPR